MIIHAEIASSLSFGYPLVIMLHELDFIFPGGFGRLIFISRKNIIFFSLIYQVYGFWSRTSYFWDSVWKEIKADPEKYLGFSLISMPNFTILSKLESFRWRIWIIARFLWGGGCNWRRGGKFYLHMTKVQDNIIVLCFIGRKYWMDSIILDIFLLLFNYFVSFFDQILEVFCIIDQTYIFWFNKITSFYWIFLRIILALVI